MSSLSPEALTPRCFWGRAGCPPARTMGCVCWNPDTAGRNSARSAVSFLRFPVPEKPRLKPLIRLEGGWAWPEIEACVSGDAAVTR